MKLLIHDFTEKEWNAMADGYKDWTAVSDDGTIRPCIGCFCCWTGGSGECVFRDGYEKMCALIHEADEMLVMSRYTYGGFSSFVKNVFDRSIGYVLPEFETAYGEMHHKKRFDEDKPVTFRFRGHELSDEERKKAADYVEAVCRNLRGHVKEVIFDECEAIDEPFKESFETTNRSGILLVDCSLRGERSNTNAFLKKLGEHLGASADMLSLSEDPEETAASAMNKAETVVLGVPLYVDGIPSPAIRLMEKVSQTGAGRNLKLYALVNNGLYESRQNVNLLNMIRDFCAAEGLLYKGGLAIGAGEVVGTLMRDMKRSLWPARNAQKGIRALADAVLSDREIEDRFADTFLFPRWLYILIANVNWQKLKKEARNR